MPSAGAFMYLTLRSCSSLLHNPIMSSGKTAEDPAWKSKEKAEEEQYARAKEAEALKAIRDELAKKQPAKSELDKDFEGGYGGQEELEDRYATTLGMH